MLNFVPLTAPALDFALVSLAKHRVDTFGRAQAEGLAAHGLEYISVAMTDGSVTLAIISDRMRVEMSDGQHIGLSGIGRTDSQLILPLDRPFGRDLDHLSDICGQFSMFRIDSSQSAVTTDAFGMGQTYSSEHNGVALVSNRLHLHKLVLEVFGLPTHLDEVAAASLLFSDFSFFAQQTSLTQTLITGVDLIPVTHDAVLRAGTLHLREKSVYTNRSRHGIKDYSDLIRLGASDLIQNAAIALESRQFSELIVDLSGGKDSRLVFAAVSQVPGWREKVRLNSKDVPGSDDLQIAAGIANRHQARFYTSKDAGTTPLSVNDNLEFWRSYFLGQYNRLGIAAWSNLGRNFSSMTLSGGLGELYRAFWSPQLHRHIEDKKAATDFAASLVHTVTSKEFAGMEVLDGVIEALAAETESLPGSSLAEKVDNHYLFHRNRFHMGMRGFSTLHERLTWLPLASAHLFTASRLIPFEERSTGRVIRDVMEAIDPDMLSIRFDGGYPFNDVPGNSVHDPVELDESLSQWEEAQRESKRNLERSRAGIPAAMSWATVEDTVRKTAETALEDFLGLADTTVNGIFASALHTRLEKAWATSASTGRQLSMRIMALRDVANPVDLSDATRL
ncbi:hypothetical protein M3B60_006815 [Micrococcus luteus]|nr:hypothetical protein [Micrococcus luteus]